METRKILKIAYTSNIFRLFYVPGKYNLHIAIYNPPFSTLKGK